MMMTCMYLRVVLRYPSAKLPVSLHDPCFTRPWENFDLLDSQFNQVDYGDDGSSNVEHEKSTFSFQDLTTPVFAASPALSEAITDGKSVTPAAEPGPPRAIPSLGLLSPNLSEVSSSGTVTVQTPPPGFSKTDCGGWEHAIFRATASAECPFPNCTGTFDHTIPSCRKHLKDAHLVQYAPQCAAVCPLCAWYSQDKRGLPRHILTHVQKKPFNFWCQYCDSMMNHRDRATMYRHVEGCAQAQRRVKQDGRASGSCSKGEQKKVQRLIL